jgi:arylsulfatase
MTNIAVVVLDTLRKDAFDRHFDWLPGVRFENAYTTANWTVPAHASLFTGIYASEAGVHAKNMSLDCESPTLAEQLHAADYTTCAFSANTNVTSYFDFDRGFESFRNLRQVQYLDDDNVFDLSEFNLRTNATGMNYYLELLFECVTDDSDTVSSLAGLARKALKRDPEVKYGGLIEAQHELADIEFGEREFLFLNLMEAHEPYRIPSDYRTVDEPDMTESVGDINFGSENTERTKQAYDNCTRYLSNAYRELFERLQAEFEYVITLSDHGEMLGEHDAWGHEYGLYPSLTHVPLVISGDGLDGEYTETVSLLDVHATILDAAGVEGDSRGRTLLEAVEGHEYLTEYHGLTSWSETNLTENGYTDQLERYNRTLRGCAAPESGYGYETPDGFVITGTNENDIEQRLERLAADLNVREVETNNEVPEEIKDQLEHLGYA